MEQQIARTAGVEEIAIVVGQILEPGIGGLDEDFRIVARRAEDALNAQHLVADGIAIAEGRQDLVHRPPERHRRTAPAGTLSRTSVAAGSVRARLAKKPGSGVITGCSAFGSRPRRSNVSRYVRSMTGQA